MSKTVSKRFAFILSLNLLLLGGCASNTPVSNNTVGSVTKEQVVTTKQATVVSVKNVAIQGRSGGVVRTVGSITGSILGSSVPYAGSILGSILGGAMGSEADKAMSKQAALEITLNLEDGEKVIVTQLATKQFKAGDKVQLITRDGKASVSHL